MSTFNLDEEKLPNYIVFKKFTFLNKVKRWQWYLLGLLVIVLLSAGCSNPISPTPKILGYVAGQPCYANILVIDGCVIITQSPVPISQTTPRR